MEKIRSWFVLVTSPARISIKLNLWPMSVEEATVVANKLVESNSACRITLRQDILPGESYGDCGLELREIPAVIVMWE